MTRREAMDILRRHRRDLDRFDVKSIALFGSTARDEAAPDSDVDILVDFHGPATFSNYMDLVHFLEDRFGAKVDLVTETGLRERVRPYVEKDATYVP